MTGLQQELKNLMEEKGLSLSSALGISSAALSQWFSNSYAGNITKIDESVKSFLQRQKERSKTPKKNFNFVMITVAKKIFDVARICHLDEAIGVCYGESGLGKTIAVKEYAKRNPDVILIEADLGYTAKVLFSELHKKLGMDGAGGLHNMFEDVVSKLKSSGRLVVVDEAEHLPYRALELLRRVYDKAGVGVLLVGMPRLIANLRGKKGEFAQLYSRVAVAGRLESLKPQDTQSIVTTVIPGSNGLWKAFHESAGGNARVLDNLLTLSTRVAGLNNMAVTPDIVNEAAEMLII